MRVKSYGVLSELISDLARLDKQIQTKRYKAILEMLDALPFDDFRDGQVMAYLKTLALALERIAEGPDGKPIWREPPPDVHGPKNIGGKAEAWTCPHCHAENIGDPIEKGRCAKCGKHWDHATKGPEIPGVPT